MALNEDFTYQLGDNGIILNTDSTTLPFVDIEKVTGLDNAPYRTTERQHEGADGGFIDAEFETSRSVILEGTLYGDGNDIEPFLDRLKVNYAPSRTLIPFYFKKPGVSERFLRVKPLGVRYDVETIRRTGQTKVQFSMVAEDPRIYTAGIHQVDILQDPVIVGGRAYNREYSYGYGAAVGTNAQNVVVGGNRITPAILTIYGPATAPRIVNETLGMTMEFNINVEAGSTLVIDTQYHTVRLDGANRRSALIDPNWFSLSPGINFIRYRTTRNEGSILSVQWFDAWR